MKIIQLSDQLANKIAAGEVVERPASVVKELVENSIDAHSTWIKIELKEAGIEQIKVIDNGDGISNEDCERAFLRHATSKIKNESDLFRIHTLGFRGEALASIASVSRLTLKTSTGDRASTYLELEGGKVIAKKKADARKGTEIIVNDLFFNTPARLKYLKTIHTELGHITDLLNRLALSHPQIRFEASHNGKVLFKTPGTGDLLHVISQVYGVGVAKKMVPIQQETLDYKIEGYIAKPELTRASRNFISIIVNGRYIKSYPLSQAIIRSYDTLLMGGRYPIAVIVIKMDPILVDFNVHPTKLEARFSKEKELITSLTNIIQAKFRQTTLIPEIQQKKPQKNHSIQHTMDFNQLRKPIHQHYSAETIYEREKPFDVSKNVNDVKKETSINIEKHQQMISKPSAEQTKNDQSQVNQDRVPIMYPIGQLHGTYILAQNETGFYMIDQHAAQERIKYEYFKKKLSEPINQLQQLLIPLTFEFSKQEEIFITQHQTELEKVGLFFEAFGQGTYVIRSHPSWFPVKDREAIIREMVEQIIEDGQVNLASLRNGMAALMACKRSIKANHHLNNDDMFHLLEDLRKCIDPFTCPHGRPIIVHFSNYELEKMFKRVL